MTALKTLDTMNKVNNINRRRQGFKKKKKPADDGKRNSIKMRLRANGKWNQKQSEMCLKENHEMRGWGCRVIVKYLSRVESITIRCLKIGM